MMKTIEEKARAYDERLAKARKEYSIHEANNAIGIMDALERVFPELKESEDEKIRKWLIRTLKSLNSSSVQIYGAYEMMLPAIAWVEKQGEHAKFRDSIQVGDKVTRNKDGVLVNLSQLKRVAKPAEKYNITGIGSKNAQGKLGEMIKNLKPADKVEPKFHEGDWVHDEGTEESYLIQSIDGNGYLVYCQETGITKYLGWCADTANYYLRRWTIQDAKDGDVLVDQNGEMPFIFKECKNNHIYCYCGYTNRKDIFFDRFVDSEGEELHWLNLYHEQAYPATKEQRDLLFQKMKEAGYSWDAEKKELKKIEQTPAEIEKGAKGNDREILISVWSEEDENIKESMITGLEMLKDGASDQSLIALYNKRIDWLKSLKDRYTWKPSDDQMKALADALSLAKNCGEEIAFDLRTLHEQLKKLRED